MNKSPIQTTNTKETLARRAYSLREACELLGCSQSHGWKMLKLGLIKGTRLGRRTLISSQEIERILSGEAA